MTPWLQSKKGKDSLLSNSWHIFNRRLIFNKRLISFEKLITYRQTIIFSLELNVSSQRKHFQNKMPLIWFWAHSFQHKFHFPLQNWNEEDEVSPTSSFWKRIYTIHLSLFQGFLRNIKAWNMARKTNGYSRTPLGGTLPRNTWETCSAVEAKSLQSTFPESI